MKKQTYFSIFVFALSLVFALMSGFQVTADVSQPWLTALEKEFESNIGLLAIGDENPEDFRIDEKELNDLYSRIDSIRLAAGSVAAQVAVLLPDTTILWNFGVADPRSQSPVDDETMFRAGSVSKSFAGISMLMLVEQGLVSLDDKLVDLAPELEIKNPWRDERPVLLSHLLEAGAGFPGFHPSDYMPADSPDIELKKVITGLPYELESQWPPGEYTVYHNIGPAITAYLVEKITNQRYEDFVQQNIFDPLNMNQSSFFRTETVKTKLANIPWREDYIVRARSMGIIREEEEPGDTYSHIRFRPAGALNTRAAELSAFVRMLLNRGEYMGQQLLYPETVERFETSTSTLAARKLGITLGHGINNWANVYNNVIYYGHSGSIPPSFAAWYGYSPTSETGLVFLGHRGENSENIGRSVVNEILQYLHPESNTESDRLIQAPELSRYAGCYSLVNPEHAEQQPIYLTVTVQERSAGVKVISAGGEVLADRPLQYWRDPGIYTLSKTEMEQQHPWEDLLVFVTDDNGNRIAQLLSRNHRAFREVSCDDRPEEVRDDSFKYQR